MTQPTPQPRLFFADPDQEYLKRIEQDPRSALTQPILTSTGKEAMEILSNPQIPLAAIFIHSNISYPDIGTLARAAAQFHVNTPKFFLFGDGEFLKLSHPELRELGFELGVSKAIPYAELVKTYLPATLAFAVIDAVERSQSNPHEVGKEIQTEDSDFFALPIDSLLRGMKTFFDLYIRLDSGRFIKILRAGDDMSPERVQAFIDKEVKYLYVRKEDQAAFVLFQQRIVNKLIELPSVSPQIKIKQTLTQGERLTELFKKSPAINNEQIQFALQYTAALVRLVDLLGIAKHSKLIQDLLKEFVKGGTPSADHHLVTIAIASILARSHGFENDRSMRIIGVAALLHDIALINTTDTLRNEDESKMSDADKKIFYSHPTRGAQVLKLMDGIDPMVLHIVTLHHRRKDGTGFPSTLGISQITPPVEIVALADTYSQLLLQTGQDPMTLLTQKHPAFSGFSNEIIAVFKRVFSLNDSLSG